MGGKVIVISSRAEYDEKIKGHSGLVVIDFTATWCGPCRRIGPVFEKLSEEEGSVLFLKVDVDEQQEIAAAEGISAMPTFYFYKNAEKVDDMCGASEAKLREMVAKHK
mmetsp:Transcript_20128/g.56610  ORF Transcript_20128/g.56610 Transcript_20128/m.56610 type:complete len:108 (+) Transcript_20128:131-454(+)|eukprot:CAMPEP_0119146214 /NCGR_PEP_ID=MMETSP1310-20130426/38557_1 /TAXON_ID=464262 /ORGANISM="Genus nov. species nov., Strain RCC2339" /LENGTH=107 /DNA_ID=CAMNT_0007138085 /DNA_START=52 /DNA_END=375 /DNA_ORIENTATION=+